MDPTVAANNDDEEQQQPLLSMSRLSEQVSTLQREIDELNERNYVKDRGKEFESSWTRVGFLMCVTYGTLFAYMSVIRTAHPALDAIVPTVGFNISTWSLPFVKVRICQSSLIHLTLKQVSSFSYLPTYQPLSL